MGKSRGEKKKEDGKNRGRKNDQESLKKLRSKGRACTHFSAVQKALNLRLMHENFHLRASDINHFPSHLCHTCHRRVLESGLGCAKGGEISACWCESGSLLLRTQSVTCIASLYKHWKLSKITDFGFQSTSLFIFKHIPQRKTVELHHICNKAYNQDGL